MTSSEIAIRLCIQLACGLLVGTVAALWKGRRFWVWMLIGSVLHFFALIALAFMSKVVPAPPVDS